MKTKSPMICSASHSHNMKLVSAVLLSADTAVAKAINSASTSYLMEGRLEVWRRTARKLGDCSPTKEFSGVTATQPKICLSR
jgi:hypothetical protein